MTIKQKRQAETPGGFSLVELMFGMTITLGMGMVVFQMFIQNQQVFSDQNLVLEMQQSARAIASMISDELRMAGQGVPIYAASQDDSGIEEIQTFLDGTDTSTLRFRAGVRNAFSTVTTPLVYTASTAALVTVAEVAAISTIVGTNSNRFVASVDRDCRGTKRVRTRESVITAAISITELEGSGRGLPLFGAGYGESNAVSLESICWCFGLNAQEVLGTVMKS